MKLEEWQTLNSLGSKNQRRKYHRGCANKHAYSAKADAEKHLYSGYFLNPEQMDCYHCQFCRWYHVGHKPGIKKKIDKLRYAPVQRRIYINHIKRLQLQNQILAAVLADERKARQMAWVWYQSRLRSKLTWLFDLLTMMVLTRK